MIVTDKLQELGIIIDEKQSYPKKPFRWKERSVISLYKRELEKDFYFALLANGVTTLYKVPAQDFNNLEKDANFEKYIVPMKDCEIIWEDKPLVEYEDSPFSSMTLRDYACIKLGIPETNTPWLNELIKRKK